MIPIACDIIVLLCTAVCVDLATELAMVEMRACALYCVGGFGYHFAAGGNETN